MIDKPFRSEILECTDCDAEFSLVLADEQNWEYCPCCGETFL